MSCEISLLRGEITIVDPDDYELLSSYRWVLHRRPDGYVRVIRHEYGRTGQTIYMAREIMQHHLGRPLGKGEFVDHINGDTLDNRKANLRLATRQQNAFNVRANRSNNSSGYKGVTYFKSRNKWVAQITHNYKHITIGYYDTPEQARDAYNEKAVALFGEFARKNTVDSL